MLVAVMTLYFSSQIRPTAPAPLPSRATGHLFRVTINYNCGNGTQLTPRPQPPLQPPPLVQSRNWRPSGGQQKGSTLSRSGPGRPRLTASFTSQRPDRGGRLQGGGGGGGWLPLTSVWQGFTFTMGWGGGGGVWRWYGGGGGGRGVSGCVCRGGGGGDYCQLRRSRPAGHRPAQRRWTPKEGLALSSPALPMWPAAEAEICDAEL